MKFNTLFAGFAAINPDFEIDGLCLDSRAVKPGDLFIALNGALQHGLRFAEQAVANGATAVVYDPQGAAAFAETLQTCKAIAVENLSTRLSEIGARFYRQPSTQLKLIGITGTNGKTTCSQLLAQAIPDCGVIGTLGWGKPGQLQPTVNTTPDALAIQQLLRTLQDQNLQTVAMEVSSHGLEQGRVNAVAFTGAVFTNLSRDHLDYHGSMTAYLNAKLKLFTNPALDFAVVNLDDANSNAVLATVAPTVKCWGFSLQGRNMTHVESLQAQDIQQHSNHTSFQVSWQQQTARVTTPIVGAFNVQNLMAVLCVLLAMDWPFQAAVDRLTQLESVVGRMESFGGQDQPLVIVDYAHTPDALEKVLQTAKGRGKLWLVFGCGGDRDTGKRPQMGQIAETYADQIIITDDNPRHEAATDIIQDILTGCVSNRFCVIHDRATAIQQAIQQAAAGDCVVIAGKGHENYQDIQGVKHPFSDQQVAQQALAIWRPQA